MDNIKKELIDTDLAWIDRLPEKQRHHFYRLVPEIEEFGGKFTHIGNCVLIGFPKGVNFYEVSKVLNPFIKDVNNSVCRLDVKIVKTETGDIFSIEQKDEWPDHIVYEIYCNDELDTLTVKILEQMKQHIQHVIKEKRNGGKS